MSLRDEALRERRREQVLLAAVRCFEAHGFHRTSMADIIAASGMSAGSVYRYYASKDDLIRACIDLVTSGADAALERAGSLQAPLDPVEALTAVIEQILSAGDRFGIDSGRLALNAWAEAARDPALQHQARQKYAKVLQELTAALARWREAGNLPPETDVEPVARVLFGALTGYVLQQQLLGDVTIKQYAAGLSTLLPGAAPHGQQRQPAPGGDGVGGDAQPNPLH